jgi:hypothetical protein
MNTTTASIMSLVHDTFDFDAALNELPARLHERTAPRGGALAIVCSPRRGVGKTLLSRLLIEHHVAEGRPVEALDLADESPQLTDYLPAYATPAGIGSIRGQMAVFEGLIGDRDAARIVDVSHRAFGSFFEVAHKIGFFAEARRRLIEPLILFLIDPDPRSAQAYALLRDAFPDSALLPVRNQHVARDVPYDTFLHQGPLHLAFEIPALASSSLRHVIEQPSFSFARYQRGLIPLFENPLPPRLDDELRGWHRRIVRQLREIDLWLMQRQILTLLH